MSFMSFLRKSASDLSPVDFKMRLDGDPDAVLVDVRTLGEYESGCIGEAEHIDYFSKDFKDRLEALPKDKNYYLYCHSGNRSRQAMNMLISMGYKAYNLDGGIMRWPY